MALAVQGYVSLSLVRCLFCLLVTSVSFDYIPGE